MIVWGKMKTIQREVVEMPDKWLYDFAASHPEAIRRVRRAHNSPLLFSSAAVLRAVDEGWGMECGGVYEQV